MKRILRFALGLSVAAALASPLAAAGRKPAGAKKAAPNPIVALDERFVTAVLAGDADRVATCYARDAVMFPPDKPAFRGQAHIRHEFGEFLGAMKVTMFIFEPDGYALSGDLASSWGTWKMRVTPRAGGDPVVLVGRASSTARKIGGKWVYVADHASFFPLPAAPKPAGTIAVR